MSAYEIQDVDESQIQEISELVWEVFAKFVGVDYEHEGVDAFRAYIVPEQLAAKFKSGDLIFKVACVENELVGVVALRGTNHISLMFVKSAYQQQGIGKALMQYVVDYCKLMKEKEITVHASAFGEQFYEKNGFRRTGDVVIENGIQYIPMRHTLKV